MADELATASVNRSITSPGVKSPLDIVDPAAQRGAVDRFWLLGYTLLFLDPSLVLFSVGLLTVGSAWLALWLVLSSTAARSGIGLISWTADFSAASPLSTFRNGTIRFVFQR